MNYFAAAVLLTTACAHGRISGQFPSPADCDQAAASLLAGERNSTSWSFLAECPAYFVTTVSAAIEASRSDSDTLYLGALVVLAAHGRDPMIASAAVSVAEDVNATIIARMAADLVLLRQYSTEFMLTLAASWTTLLSATLGSECPISPSGHGDYVIDNPVPVDFQASIAHHFRIVAGDPGQPAALRSLAACIDRYIGGRHPPK